MCGVCFDLICSSTLLLWCFVIVAFPGYASQKYPDADVVKMLEYIIDNIFVEFGGHIFQQTIVILMGTICFL